jgi:hypothetical protein
MVLLAEMILQHGGHFLFDTNPLGCQRQLASVGIMGGACASGSIGSKMGKVKRLTKVSGLTEEAALLKAKAIALQVLADMIENRAEMPQLIRHADYTALNSAEVKKTGSRPQRSRRAGCKTPLKSPRVVNVRMRVESFVSITSRESFRPLKFCWYWIRLSVVIRRLNPADYAAESRSPLMNSAQPRS